MVVTWGEGDTSLKNHLYPLTLFILQIIDERKDEVTKNKNRHKEGRLNETETMINKRVKNSIFELNN